MEISESENAGNSQLFTKIYDSYVYVTYLFQNKDTMF